MSPPRRSVLGTLYAASFLRERGYDVALFDAMVARSEAEWGEALDRHEPRFAIGDGQLALMLLKPALGR